MGGPRSGAGRVQQRSTYAALEFFAVYGQETADIGPARTARGCGGFDETVRANGNKPISSLSSVAEPHCASVMVYTEEAAPILFTTDEPLQHLFACEEVLAHATRLNR